MDEALFMGKSKPKTYDPIELVSIILLSYLFFRKKLKNVHLNLNLERNLKWK